MTVNYNIPSKHVNMVSFMTKYFAGLPETRAQLYKDVEYAKYDLMPYAKSNHRCKSCHFFAALHKFLFRDKTNTLMSLNIR